MNKYFASRWQTFYIGGLGIILKIDSHNSEPPQMGNSQLRFLFCALCNAPQDLYQLRPWLTC